VIFSCLSFAWSNATRIKARRYTDADENVVYEIHGPLFFGSASDFQLLFSPADDTNETTVDLKYTYLHDYSAISAVETVAGKYSEAGKEIHLVNLSPSCRALLVRSNSRLIPGTHNREHEHVATERLAAEAKPAIAPVD